MKRIQNFFKPLEVENKVQQCSASQTAAHVQREVQQSKLTKICKVLLQQSLRPPGIKTFENTLYSVD